MGGSSNKTTKKYYQTGLGDEQYGNLNQQGRETQGLIRGLGQTQAGHFADADKRLDNISGQVGDVQSGLGTVNNNVTDVGRGVAGVSDQVAGVGSQVSGVSDQISGLGGEMNDQFAGVNDNLSGLGTSMNDQFAAQNDTMNTNFDALGTGMMAGFDATGQGLQAAEAARQQYFNDLKGLMNTGFTDAASQLSGVQAGLVEGQGNINQNVLNNTDKIDTAYAGLAQGQEGLMGEVGRVQENLGDFRQNYDRNTSLADQARARMQGQMEGGFGAVQNQNAQIANTSQAAQQAMQQQLTGLAAPQPNAAQQAQEISSRLSTVKNLLANASDQLDPSIAQTFSLVAASFDQQGLLIPAAQLEDGSVLRRSMDAQGNLLTRQFDQQGNLLGQNAVNLDRVLTQAELLSNQAYATNNSSQYTEPQKAMGFVSPYMGTA